MKRFVSFISLLSICSTEIAPADACVDAWEAAWLPGTEGGGLADVLFGDYPFTGKSPYFWPRSNEQLPININNISDKIGCDGPLFSFGYGLAYGEMSPETLECEP